MVFRKRLKPFGEMSKGRLIVYDMSCERVFKSTRISKKYVIRKFKNLYHDFLINKF